MMKRAAPARPAPEPAAPEPERSSMPVARIAGVLALTLAASALTAMGVHWLLDKAAPMPTPARDDDTTAKATTSPDKQPAAAVQDAEAPKAAETKAAEETSAPKAEAAAPAVEATVVKEVPPAMLVATPSAEVVAAAADEAAEMASHDPLRLTAAPHPLQKQRSRFRAPKS
jgi:hypothetical protein